MINSLLSFLSLYFFCLVLADNLAVESKVNWNSDELVSSMIVQDAEVLNESTFINITNRDGCSSPNHQF